MVTIPDNPVTMQDLVEWYQSCEELTRIKMKEMLLRKKIFNFYFPTPEEGTNTSEPLPDGALIKGKYKIDRKVDEAVLNVLKPTFLEKGFRIDDLIRYKPELSVTAYRKLTAEEQKFFDQTLIIKPGAPELDIVVPAKKDK